MNVKSIMGQKPVTQQQNVIYRLCAISIMEAFEDFVIDNYHWPMKSTQLYKYKSVRESSN